MGRYLRKDDATGLWTEQAIPQSDVGSTRFPSYVPSGLLNDYDPKFGWYNLKQSNTRKWRAGLGRAAGGGMGVGVVISNSSGAGCNQAILAPLSFDRRNSWPASMAKQFARNGIPMGGTGLIRCVDGPAASDSRWGSTGTVGNSSAYVTLNANAATVTCTLTAADFFSLGTYTAVEIPYRDDGTGTWTASVNGAGSGAGFASTTNANTGLWKRIVLTGVAVVAGSTLTLTRVSSSVNMPFAGANFYTPDAGLVVHNFSQSGATATGTGFQAWGDTSSTGLGGVYKDMAHRARSVVDAAFTNANATVGSATGAFTNADVNAPLSRSAAVVPFTDNAYISSVTDGTHVVMNQNAQATLASQILIIDRDPDFVGISLGGNDLPGSTGAAVITAITTIKNLFPSSDIFLVAEHQKNDTLIPAGTWEAFIALLYTQADTWNIPLFDQRSRIGNYTTALGNGLMGDNAAHLLVGAYIDWGRAVANGVLA